MNGRARLCWSIQISSLVHTYNASEGQSAVRRWVKVNLYRQMQCGSVLSAATWSWWLQHELSGYISLSYYSSYSVRTKVRKETLRCSLFFAALDAWATKRFRDVLSDSFYPVIVAAPIFQCDDASWRMSWLGLVHWTLEGRKKGVVTTLRLSTKTVKWQLSSWQIGQWGGTGRLNSRRKDVKGVKERKEATREVSSYSEFMFLIQWKCKSWTSSIMESGDRFILNYHA